MQKVQRMHPRTSAQQKDAQEGRQLQESFDEKLRRLDGDLPEYSDSRVHSLYRDLLEELTRREEAACPARGGLLKRVGVEMELSLESQRQRYRSSFACGVRKSLLSHHSGLSRRRETSELQRAAEGAEQRAGALIRKRMEEERQSAEEEQIRRAERHFRERQLKAANEEIVALATDRCDREHRWLGKSK